LIGREDAEELAQKIIDKDLTVRDVEALVQALDLGDEQPLMRRVREKDPDTRAFEQELTQVLGLRVEVKKGSGESGTLAIKYATLEQLEFIRELLARSKS
ncbi:MAG: ParB/RepB/Spo0J family partition protein, partial [Hyphomicrobiaceae bacterium]